MTETAEIEITGEAFAMRLANLVASKREERGISVRQLAKQSHGIVTKNQLRAIEAGTAPLDEELIDVVAELYGADLAAILPMRLPVTIREGFVVAGGVSAAFSPADPDSLLLSYLRLVRRMRKLERAPFVDLRRDDIEAIAAYLRFSGEGVVDRLGALMGSTRTQRSAMAAMFASGAVVIGLVGGAAAIGGSDQTAEAVAPQSRDSMHVVTVTPAHDAFHGVVVTEGGVDGHFDGESDVVVDEQPDAQFEDQVQQAVAVSQGPKVGPRAGASEDADASTPKIEMHVAEPPVVDTSVDWTSVPEPADGSVERAGGDPGNALPGLEPVDEIESAVGAPPLVGGLDDTSDIHGDDSPTGDTTAGGGNSDAVDHSDLGVGSDVDRPGNSDGTPGGGNTNEGNQGNHGKPDKTK